MLVFSKLLACAEGQEVSTEAQLARLGSSTTPNSEADFANQSFLETLGDLKKSELVITT
jgi:hypothetical protein